MRIKIFKAMKIKLTLFLLISCLTSYAQSSKLVGEYHMKNDNSGMSQEYTLILKEDGTFLFNQYWKESPKRLYFKDQDGMQSTGNEKGKGKWIYKNNTVVFISDTESEIDQNYRLNFNNSKAKLENNSSLVFWKSELFWLENLKMKKKS